jgi:STE24 endopeptidase
VTSVGRTFALVAAAGLVALAGAVVAVGTPWRPLEEAPEGTDGGADVREDDFSEQERARGARRAAESRRPAYLRLGVGLGSAAGLGLTPLGGGLIEAAARPVGDGWLGQATVGAAALFAVGTLAVLPFGAWSERLARRWGLSVQTWRSWSVDRLKGLALGVVLLLLVVPPAFALTRASPEWWWVVGALAAAALTVVLSFVFPMVVEPLFAKFRPLEAGPLRDDLLALAVRDGVAVTDVLVADASRRTTALNAYVSGFGRTRRIVVYDTLLTNATPAEVRLVVAHELGHAKEQDVLRGTVVGAVLAASSVVLLHLALTEPTLLRWAGAGGVEDPRSLALALLVAQVIGVVTGPGLNLVSRRVEARADVHSLDLTRDPTSFVSAERRLALTNLADLEPPLLARALFGSHPTVPERIALARRWAARERVDVPGPLLAEAAGPAAVVGAASGGSAS